MLKMNEKINTFWVNFTKNYAVVLTKSNKLRYNTLRAKKNAHPAQKKCSYRKEGNIQMSEIKVNNGNIEDALKRFKRQCARNGVLQEVRKREHYEKPSVKRKKKSEAARKRKF